MKKTTKLLAVMLVITMLAALCAGCGNTGSGSGASNAPETQEPAASQPASEPDGSETPTDEPEAEWQYGDFTLPICDETVTLTEIKFLTADEIALGGPYETEGYKTFQEMTNVEIEFSLCNSENKASQVALAITTGDYPDIWTGLNGIYGYSLEGAYEEGIIMDLTDVIDEYMPNYMYVLGTNDEYALNAVTSDGKYVQINQYATFAETQFGLITRADWLKALDLETPVTFDDYHDMLKAMNTEYGATFVLGADGVCDSNYLAAGYGIAALSTVNFSGVTYPIYQENGTVKYGPIQDGYKEYLEMMSQWYSEGLINEDFMSLNVLADGMTLQASGKCSLMTTMSILIDMFEAQSTEEGFEIAALSDAVKNPGDINHIGFATDLYQGESFALSTTCSNVEVACKYLDYGYTPQGIMMANWGPENVGYVLDENGEPKLSEYIIQYAADNNMDPVSALSEFNSNGKGGLSMKDNSANDAGLSDRIKYIMTDVWGASTDNAWMMPAGATLNSDESNEFTNIYNDIGTYVQEYLLGVIVGERSLDEWDSYVETIKGMDIDRCMEIWQGAYDRYASRA